MTPTTREHLNHLPEKGDARFVITITDIVHCLFMGSRGTNLKLTWSYWHSYTRSNTKNCEFTFTFFNFKSFAGTFVVYFDQQKGAPQAIRWSKSFVFAFKQFFLMFPPIMEKKEKERKAAQKHAINIFFYFFWVILWLKKTRKMI